MLVGSDLVLVERLAEGLAHQIVQGDVPEN
jgi:hypothetical protein